MSELRVTSITDEQGTGSPEFPNGIAVNSITNEAGTGAPSFPEGITSSGEISANNLLQDGSQVYSRSNVLGTVSESAGVPTGAIIERGSNVNGEFVKFADGTLICQMFQENFDFNTTGTTDFVHPAFAVNRFPVHLASLVDGSTGSIAANEAIALLGLSGTDGNTRATVTTARSVTNRTLGITVIGRWF